MSDILIHNNSKTTWLRICNLTNLQESLIRSIAKEIFSSFGNPVLHDVEFLITDQDMVRTLCFEISRNGEVCKRGNLEFSKVFPGYNPLFVHIKSCDYNYLVVRDNFSTYLYRWPLTNNQVIENSLIKRIK